MGCWGQQLQDVRLDPVSCTEESRRQILWGWSVENQRLHRAAWLLVA